MDPNTDPSGSSVSPRNDSDDSKHPRPYVKRRRATNVSPAIKSALAQYWLSFIAGCGDIGRRFVSEFRDAVLHGQGFDRKRAVAFLRPLRRGPLGPKVDEIEASIERTTGVTQHYISRWARYLLEHENDFPVPEVIRGVGIGLIPGARQSQSADVLAAAHLTAYSYTLTLETKNSAEGAESQGATAATTQTGGDGMLAKPSASMAVLGSEPDQVASKTSKTAAGGEVGQVSDLASGARRTNTEVQASPTDATIAPAKTPIENEATSGQSKDSIHQGVPTSAGGEPTRAPSLGVASAATGAPAVAPGSGGDAPPREQARPTTLQNLYIHAIAGASASSAPTGLAPIPRPPAGSSPRSSREQQQQQQQQQPAMGRPAALARVPKPDRGPAPQPAMVDDSENPEDFRRRGNINPPGGAAALQPSAEGPPAATTGPISMRTSRGRAVRRPATWTDGEVQLNGVNVLGSGSEALSASKGWRAVRDLEDEEEEDEEEDGAGRKRGPRRMRVHLRRGESPSSAAQRARARARLGQLAAGSIDAGAGRLLLLHKIAASTSTDMLDDHGHDEGEGGGDEVMGKGTKPSTGRIHPEWPFGSIRCDQFDADVFPASVRGLPRRMERAVRNNAGLLAFSQHLYASVIRESEPKIVGAVLSVLRKHRVAVPSPDVLAAGGAGQPPANAGPGARPYLPMQHPHQTAAGAPPPMGMGMGVPMGMPVGMAPGPWGVPGLMPPVMTWPMQGHQGAAHLQQQQQQQQYGVSSSSAGPALGQSRPHAPGQVPYWHGGMWPPMAMGPWGPVPFVPPAGVPPHMMHPSAMHFMQQAQVQAHAGKQPHSAASVQPAPPAGTVAGQAQPAPSQLSQPFGQQPSQQQAVGLPPGVAPVPVGAPKTTTSEQGVATTLVTTFPVPETNAAMGGASPAPVSSSSSSSAAATAATASRSLLPRTTVAGTAAGVTSTSAPTPAYAPKQAVPHQAPMQSVQVSRDQLFGSEPSPSASHTSGQGGVGAPTPAAGGVDQGVGPYVGVSYGLSSKGFHYSSNDAISRLVAASPRPSAQATYSGARRFGAPMQVGVGSAGAGSVQSQGTSYSSGVPNIMQKPPSMNSSQRWDAPTDKAESDHSGSCRSGDESGSVVSGMSVRGDVGRHREGFEEGMHEVREDELLPGGVGGGDGPMGSGLGMGKDLLGGEGGGILGSGHKRAADGLLGPDEPSAKRARL